ncbi:HNH endonuclease signature motif containing protein [Streptomyces atriruber]|uniref:HNH endonuclease signature motif containing protein n=1 Tax=Streptomyces atriruber TaxID=545121 RepID=UPI001ABFEF0D
MTGDKVESAHFLVCVAFHGPRPTASHQVAHGDGDPTNNRPCNLRWATPAENSAGAVRHGTAGR